MHFGVRKMIERPQQDAAPGVKCDAAADVRMGRDELRDRADLGLGCRKRPGAQLLVLLSPISREVSVKINALNIFLNL